MFRPHCGHLQANLYKLGALNVRTIWDPIVCKILTYRICSRNLRTFFFSILAAEKSGCVKYADFFSCGCLDLGFILV